MGDKVKKRSRLKCPICKKPTYWENNPYRPFCSKECKLADLFGWLSEEYSIKVSENETEIKGGDSYFLDKMDRD